MGGDFSADILDPKEIVSIHAPAWGATYRGLCKQCKELCFNPRPRMGGDVDLDDLNDNLFVSIHAPAWGATSRHRFEYHRL